MCAVPSQYTLSLGLAALLAMALKGSRVEGGANLQEVLSAWKARQASTKSIDFKWSALETRTKFETEALRPPGTRTSPVSPPDQATFKASMRFVVESKRRVRFDYDGQNWSDSQGKYVPFRTLEVFDGSARTVFFPIGHEFPSAHITKAEAATSARDVRSLPLLLLYYPIDASLGQFRVDDVKFTDQKGIVGETHCLVLKHNEESLWVDPAMDFVPLRYYQYRKGAIHRHIELSYTQDKVHGWTAKSWKNVSFGPSGDLLDSMTSTVTEYKINEGISDGDFVLTYPSGTWVNNHMTKDRYLVREGGSKRPILDGEYNGSNYETILRTEPPGSSSRFWTIAGIAIALAVLLGGALFFYKRAKLHKTDFVIHISRLP
ncbi:MAG: hypothetical protein L0Y72_26090 [Gemmataceae bacterium]|nr:hypothetical protein [Gemmataceae bacterium]